MNPLDLWRNVAAANMMGMGDDVLSATRPRVVGSLPSSGHSTRDLIFGAIGAGLQTVNNIFGQPQQQQPVFYPQQLPQPQNYQAPASAISQGVGQGFGGIAAGFGVSPTTLALLLVGGAYLLFRQPPRR